jgi:DNA-binding CsgD family transcriptional regulator
VDGPDLSRREAEVLALLGENLRNAEIADRLVLSVRTVESHVSSLLRKLGAADRRDLGRLAAERLRPPAAPSPARLPAALAAVADPGSFVGRSQELDALSAQWKVATAGDTVGAVVVGEAGVGKTRTVAEFAREVHAGGGRVLLGTNHRDEDEPYGPLVQAMVADAETLTDDELRSRGRSREVLGLLGPRAARALGLERSARRHTPDREAILDAIEAWFAATSHAQAVLLVIEDLHWSTATTRDAVRQLLRGRVGGALILGTTRSTPADLSVGCEELLGELRRLPTVAEIELGALSVDEVATLAAVEPDEAERIRTETRGNTLLIKLLAGPAEGRDHSLESFLAERDEHLASNARDVLDLASAIGVEFQVDLLARAHGEGLASVLAALEAAEAVGLVVAPHEGATHFTFAHALVRDQRYGGLPWRRRLELHARIAQALDDRDDVDLSTHARHACLAVPLASARPAVQLARRAAEAADRVYAYGEAAAHYGRAVDVARTLDPPDPVAVLELTVGLAAARHHGGDPEGLADLVFAAEQARLAGDRSALVRAAMSLPQFGAPLNPIGADHRVADVVDGALEVIGPEPSAQRALLELFLVQTRTFWEHDDHQLLVAAGERCEAMARDLDDPDVLATVLLHAIHFRSHPNQVTEYERIANELARLGRATDRLAVALVGLNGQAAVMRSKGDLAGWRAGTNRVAELLGGRPVPWFQLMVAAARSQEAFYDGDLSAAEAIARDLAPLATAVGHGPGPWTGSILAAVRRARAEDARLVPALEKVVALEGPVSARRCVLAAAYARAGDLEAANRVLDIIRRGGFQTPQEYSWAPALGELAEAADVVGDPETANHVLSELGACRGPLGLGPGIPPPFDQTLAQAALAAGSPETAEVHAAGAVQWCRTAVVPVFLARSLVFLAEARHRSHGSVRAVAPLVDEALLLARKHDVRAAVVDIDRYGLRA